MQMKTTNPHLKHSRVDQAPSGRKELPLLLPPPPSSKFRKKRKEKIGGRVGGVLRGGRIFSQYWQFQWVRKLTAMFVFSADPWSLLLVEERKGGV